MLASSNLELIGALIADHIKSSDLLAGQGPQAFLSVDVLQEAADDVCIRPCLDEDLS
jgi:hypothetical protein